MNMLHKSLLLLVTCGAIVGSSAQAMKRKDPISPESKESEAQEQQRRRLAPQQSRFQEDPLNPGVFWDEQNKRWINPNDPRYLQHISQPYHWTPRNIRQANQAIFDAESRQQRLDHLLAEARTPHVEFKKVILQRLYEEWKAAERDYVYTHRSMWYWYNIDLRWTKFTSTGTDFVASRGYNLHALLSGNETDYLYSAPRQGQQHQSGEREIIDDYRLTHDPVTGELLTDLPNRPHDDDEEFDAHLRVIANAHDEDAIPQDDIYGNDEKE